MKPFLFLIAALLPAIFLPVSSTFGQRVRVLLKDGRALVGREDQISAVDEGLEIKGKPRIRTILVVDDGLRRTYVPKYKIAHAAIDTSPQLLTFKIPQRRIAVSGTTYSLLGDYNASTRFDGYGRRTVGLLHGGGVEQAVQAITEINPIYIRAQGLKRVWDMRIATNAVPREVLTPVILAQLDDPKNLEDRKRLISFYIQAELYREAVQEINATLDDFDDDPEVRKELAQYRINVRNLEAGQYLRELQLRFDAGQYELAHRGLERFDIEGLPSRIVRDARRMLERYNELQRRRTTVLEEFDRLLEAETARGELDEAMRQTLRKFRTEIHAELNFNTVDRFSLFELHRQNPNYGDTQKLALAVASWLVGSNVEVDRLSTALSLYQVRELIVRFLNEPNPTARQGLVEELKDQEAATPELVAKLLAYMKPPLQPRLETPDLPDGTPQDTSEDSSKGTRDTPAKDVDETDDGVWRRRDSGTKTPVADETPLPDTSRTQALRDMGGDPERPGYFVLRREGFLPNDPLYAQYEYEVQLPPEYDPNRRYPAIVTLNALTTTPQTQIDWWAGPWNGTQRVGQATRHGYIVVAPKWNPAMLLDYDFSGLSHAAVLYTLKDAMRRFNIDSDRVFLSGHGIGGTAAWDIASAHPELWTGVIVVNGVAGKTINAYVENLRQLPFYYVGGELAGFNGQSMFLLNAWAFNKYLAPMSNPFEATVALYRGRGSESYSDEILRLFDWMSRHTRDVTPTRFSMRTLRFFDDFFWWVELNGMARDRKLGPRMIDPAAWPERDGGIHAPKPVVVESRLHRNVNAVRITVAPPPEPAEGDEGVVVFLTPDMVDFDEKAEVTVNNHRYHPPNGMIEPKIEVMLEDVRTRADRLHPFWVRLTRRGR